MRWRIGASAGLPVSRQLVPVPGLAAVRVGSRLIDDRSGAATVRVDAATEFVPWVVSDPADRVGERSALADCNNREPLDRTELAHRVRDLPGGLVELSARRHSACVSWSIERVRPGRTYQVRIEGWSDSGRAPRWCIWQVGPDRCAELEPTTSADGRRIVLSTLWTPAAGTTAASLYVYADGDEADPDRDPDPGRPARMTVTRYRTPSVVEVVDRPAVRLRLSPPTRAEITVPPGRHRVEAERTAASPVVGRPGPVKDCHRYDDQTIEEAGITADVAQDGTMTLSASDHSACLEIPVAGIQSAMPYRVSFEHRTLSGERRATACSIASPARACARAASTSPDARGSAPRSRSMHPTPLAPMRSRSTSTPTPSTAAP